MYGRSFQPGKGRAGRAHNRAYSSRNLEARGFLRPLGRQRELTARTRIGPVAVWSLPCSVSLLVLLVWVRKQYNIYPTAYCLLLIVPLERKQKKNGSPD